MGKPVTETASNSPKENMIIDFQTLLSGVPGASGASSTGQAITASAASTNIYDTGSTSDPAPGTSPTFFAYVKQVFNNLTSLDIALQTSNDSTFGTGVVTVATRNYLLAGLTAKTRLDVPGVKQGLLRYVRLYYTVNGTAPTTGSIIAGLIVDQQANVPVPNEFGL